MALNRQFIKKKKKKNLFIHPYVEAYFLHGKKNEEHNCDVLSYNSDFTS